MRNVAMIQRFVRDGYLVPVRSSTQFYYLHAVGSQYRYCRRWTKLFLDHLSRQFYAKFGERLRITSLVRTAASQERLEGRNGNAADAFGPARSSHLTGATLDISKRWMSASERRWLRSTLYSLRQRGYVYAIEEFYQPAFHVMVYENYPQSMKVTGKRPRGRLHASRARLSASGAD